MATEAAIGYGYTLSGSIAGDLVEITELKPGKKTVQKIEIKSNTSTDLYGDVIPGWKTEGDWEVKCVYTAAKRTALEAAVAVTQDWTFTRPDGSTTSAFSGFLSELGDEVPLRDHMGSDFKITVSGKTTFAS